MVWTAARVFLGKRRPWRTRRRLAVWARRRMAWLGEARRLTWIIIGELALVAAVGGLAGYRFLAGRGEEGDDVKPPFAVRWTHEPLGQLAEPCVKVCKSRRVLTVYDGERPVKSYRVAVGSQPGDKQREGDRRTPEGELTVCVRNPNSRYVVSLGLSYPNEEDAARGLRDGLITQAQHDAIADAVRQDLPPPWDTPLGGEIMIHGCRGGRDTTLGCVAMEDDAIRELYPRLPLGTPVTILP